MDHKNQTKKFIKNPIQGTKFTIAISSAKGGVGKSTFATNIALALKKIGCKVGLLDADIYGPSLPKLFSIKDKPESDGKTLIPINKYDIQCMSIGFLTDEQTPMMFVSMYQRSRTVQVVLGGSPTADHNALIRTVWLPKFHSTCSSS